MAQFAFLFPGQGSQAVGMGQVLFNSYNEARDTFETADKILGFPLSQLCFEGPDDELKRTENTQPALLTVSVAAYRVLARNGLKPAIVAGHSLGEYSALVAAGSLSFEDALVLVRRRGTYMQEAVPVGIGAMAALLKMPEDKLESVLAEAAQGEVVTAANRNSPDQIVIAGHVAAVQRAMELAKVAGAKRAVLLPVSAPFHCPLMTPAQERLRTDLDKVEFHDLSVPLVRNWDAKQINKGSDAREGLFQQVPNPVLWTDSVRAIIKTGINQFIEVGAGSVLVGLCRAIDPSFRGLKFGAPDDLESVLKEFSAA